jgi:hypothetical protein
MNKYLIAAIATVSIAFSAGTALACQKLNSANTQTERPPQTQQSSSTDTNQQPG